MRYPADQKEKTRRHIVETVSRAIRRDGIAASSIVPLMREAGLTQGAFYAHFGTRDELLIEVIALAMAQTRAFALDWIAASERDGRPATAHFIEGYLSLPHVLSRESACLFVALGPEFWRQAPAVKRTAAQAFTDIAALLASTMSVSQQPMAGPLYMMMAGVLSCTRLLETEKEQLAMLAEGRRAAFTLAALRTDGRAAAVPKLR